MTAEPTPLSAEERAALTANTTPFPWRVVSHDGLCEDEWALFGPDDEQVFSCTSVAYEGGGSPPKDEDAVLIMAIPRLLATIDALTDQVAALKEANKGLWALKKNGDENAEKLDALYGRVEAAEAERDALKAALKLVRFNWAGHAEECAFVKTRSRDKCDCDWPKIAAQIDAALSPIKPQEVGDAEGE